MRDFLKVVDVHVTMILWVSSETIHDTDTACSQ